MTLFKTLEKYQLNREKQIRCSDEFSFFNKNKTLLSPVEMYHFLVKPKNDFDLIRANIVIRSLLNKSNLDKLIVFAFKESKMKTDEVTPFIHESMTGMPYLIREDIKVYVPIFSYIVNEYYYQDFGKLLVQPYSTLLDAYYSSCVDLFETYNFDLYDSLFTKLITVYRDDNILVTFHYEFKTIYIINNQGRLENKIALFDKFIKHPNYTHIFERIQPVVKAYVNNDKIGLIQALLHNKLISKKLLTKISSNNSDVLLRALGIENYD